MQTFTQNITHTHTRARTHRSQSMQPQGMRHTTGIHTITILLIHTRAHAHTDLNQCSPRVCATPLACIQSQYYSFIRAHTHIQVSPDAAKVCATELDVDQVFVTSIEPVNTTALRRRASHRQRLQHKHNNKVSSDSDPDITHTKNITRTHFERLPRTSQRRLLQHGHSKMPANHSEMTYIRPHNYFEARRPLQHVYSRASSNHTDIADTISHKHYYKQLPKASNRHVLQHERNITSSRHTDTLHNTSKLTDRARSFGSHTRENTGQNSDNGQITEHDILKLIWEVRTDGQTDRRMGGRQTDGRTDRRQENTARGVTYFRASMQFLGSPDMPDGMWLM
jgi:hypothetical protein